MIEHIRGLAIFAKVAETGSFRGAARVLSMSPSVVSQQIATLEARLGVALVYRSTRALSLTPDGEALLTFAQAMIGEAEKGLSQISHQAAVPMGELNITLPDVLSLSCITDILAEFSTMYPGIALNVNFSDTKLNPIRDGYDLAIRVGWVEDSALKCKSLGEITRILVASRNYVKNRKPLENPDAILTWDFVRFESVDEKFTLHQDGQSPVAVSPSSRISANSAIAAYRFSCADAGVAIVLDFLARNDLETGTMVQLLPDWYVDRAVIHATWPHNAPRNGLVIRLVDFLEERLMKVGSLHSKTLNCKSPIEFRK